MYVNRVEPEDKLIGIDEISGEQTIADFWRWAFSDLCDDDVKGIFAEWLVCRLLDLPMTRRFSWANCDIRTPGGVRIEVKSSAWWQSWRLLNGDGSPREPRVEPSQVIQFRRLKSRDPELYGVCQGGEKDIVASYHADLYVFAIQNEHNAEIWNALDLRQWTFYLLTRNQVEGTGYASMSLKWLESKHSSLTAAEFRKAGLAALSGLTHGE
jgi:hypothetical protein